MSLIKLIIYSMCIVLTVIIAWCVNIDLTNNNPFNFKLVVPYILIIILSIIMLIDNTKIKSIVKIKQWGRIKWDQLDDEKQEDLTQISGIVGLILIIIYLIWLWTIMN